MGVFANATFAADMPRLGYIELCKAANTDLKGQFTFTITDATTPAIPNVVLSQGTCSAPIAVKAGDVTVNETGSSLGLDANGNSVITQEFLNAPTTTVVSATDPGPYPLTGFSRTVSVPASTNGTSGVVTLTYANSLKLGVVEVCKSIVAGSGLTGSWQFTLTGENGYSSVQTVAASTCSSPVTVPAGHVIVRETGDASENVTAITATQGALPGTNAVTGGLSLATATVVVAVQAGDASTQTLVTMTNDSVRLKLCKYVDQGLTNTGPYTFRFGTVTGNAGPNATPGPVSITAGTAAAPICTVVGTFRAGSIVPITEDIVAGTKVGSITVNPSTDAYDGTPTYGSLSTANRTVTVELTAGETVVTYENIPASPGTLKICKVAGTSTPPVPATQAFTFTVTPPTGSPITLSLLPGSCGVVGTFPYDTTLGIVETAVANMTVQSITAVPGFVIVNGGNTNQPVLSNTVLATRSTSVTIGEGNITEVTYVNTVTPPSPPPGSPPPGGTTGGGTTSASDATPSGASPVAASTSTPTPVAASLPAAPTPVTRPSISIVKSPKSQSIADGGTATFRITVTNRGDVALTRVTVTDPLSPNCDRSLGTMAGGASSTYSCTRQSARIGFTNIATATGKPPTGPTVSASSSALVSVAPFTPPKLVVKKVRKIEKKAKHVVKHAKPKVVKPKVVSHATPTLTG